MGSLTKKLDSIRLKLLNELWFLHGNYGPAHTDRGHKFIQKMIESHEDLSNFYKPNQIVLDDVKEIIKSNPRWIIWRMVHFEEENFRSWQYINWINTEIIRCREENPNFFVGHTLHDHEAFDDWFFYRNRIAIKKCLNTLKRLPAIHIKPYKDTTYN